MLKDCSEYNAWQKDLSDSVIALNKIKNIITENLISGTIHTIEQSDNEILMKLDIKSGIDFIVEKEEGLQGIASRVQWGKAWDTFTIRAVRCTGSETELSKRLRQIDGGYFYPAYTMQAYFDNRESNNLLSIGVVKTKDLYTLLKNKPHLFSKQKSDNEFLFISFDDYAKEGLAIKRYRG